MSYTSINFLAFVSISAILYFSLPLKRNKWIVLLAASCIFYMYAGFMYIAFIILTSASTYLIAIWLDRVSCKAKQELIENKTVWSRQQKKQHKNKNIKNKRMIMALALVINFGVLAFLKYYNFFAGSLNDFMGVFSISFSAPTLKLFLPLGISFYTFQSMGYVIDVYREKFPAERNPAKLALFVSFFPQIVQGPISFYDQLAHQLYEPHRVDFTRIKYGCELILWGFFKKLVIADRAVIAINSVITDYDKYSGTTLLFTVLLYALQLYADFSGGIDISRGVAQIFGIDLAENFRRPYFSKSISEYWRRWHITLGAWMKDYLFYPLAMSNIFLSASKKMKKSRFGLTKAGSHIAKVLPTAVASLVVFIIVGIWHGSSWKYVAFGLWNGGVIMISILLKPLFDIILMKLHIDSKSIIWKLFQMLRTFVIVCIGYIFDVAPSFRQAMRTIVYMVQYQSIKSFFKDFREIGIPQNSCLILALSTAVLYVVSIWQERHHEIQLRVYLDKKPYFLRWVLICSAVIFVFLFGVYGPEYSVSGFVYARF